jgi:hypothetical protein
LEAYPSWIDLDTWSLAIIPTCEYCEVVLTSATNAEYQLRCSIFGVLLLIAKVYISPKMEIARLSTLAITLKLALSLNFHSRPFTEKVRGGLQFITD